MENKIFEYFYKRYEKKIEERIISQFFADIPENLREPSLEFLAGGKNTLERFFSIQAYRLTRRAVQEKDKAEFYDGALMIIKAFLFAISSVKIQPKPVAVQENKEVKKPEDGVREFEKAALEAIRKKK
jgi:5'-deoxynucleotidase YfbR-like HD superfamily hydrolase